MPLRRRRVPMRYQLTQTECAAACLAMVRGYHGHSVSVPECRALLSSGRDGVSVAELTRAGEKAGFQVRVDRSKDPFGEPLIGPAIAYLRRRHFVVVVKTSRQSVHLVDPALGRRRVSRVEFAEQYGRLLLHLTPDVDFRRRRPTLRAQPMARYFTQFINTPGSRGLLGVTLLLAVGMQLLGLATPLLTRYVVGSVVPGDRIGSLPAVGFGILVVAVVSGLTALGRALAVLTVRLRGDQVMSFRLVSHLFRLPVGFFLDRARGDLIMRLSSISSTREVLTQQLMTTVIDGFLLVGYLVGLLVVCPVYGLALIPLLVLQLLVLTATHNRMRALAHLELRAHSEEQSYLTETLEAIVPLKANGVEHRAVDRWGELFGVYQRAVSTKGRTAAGIGALRQAVATLAPLALLWLGTWLVLTHRLSLAGMLAANGVALSVLAPLETFASSGQMYQAIRAQVDRIFDIVDSPAEPSGTRRLSSEKAMRIQLRDITFRYQENGKAILSGLDLDLAPGGKLGIVGRTGSGKSTLGLLILGLLRPSEGTVTIDGVASDELDVWDLRARCGAVLQELTLFNGTIRDNLALARPDAREADLVDAARIAGLHDDVLALPMGYDTLVGQSGNALSAGQRQRIALARALIHRPRVLLLDEATSHLDPSTEREVDAALHELAVTRVVISHRLSAVRNADEILVLDEGRVAQRGRHRELITSRGLYRDLFGADVPAEAPPQSVVV